MVSYVIGSEVWYAHNISPDGVSTVHEFFERFGEPQHVQMVQRDGVTCYEFTGRLPPRFVVAFPSAPPSYVFDEGGHFVTWCPDPGDIPSFRQDWPHQNGDEADIALIREKFGIR
jgi:hypothetical protein